VIRLALLLACCGGCVNVPQRVEVYSPTRMRLATVDLERGEVTLTPEAWALLSAMHPR